MGKLLLALIGKFPLALSSQNPIPIFAGWQDKLHCAGWPEALNPFTGSSIKNLAGWQDPTCLAGWLDAKLYSYAGWLNTNNLAGWPAWYVFFISLAGWPAWNFIIEGNAWHGWLICAGWHGSMIWTGWPECLVGWYDQFISAKGSDRTSKMLSYGDLFRFPFLLLSSFLMLWMLYISICMILIFYWILLVNFWNLLPVIYYIRPWRMTFTECLFSEKFRKMITRGMSWVVLIVTSRYYSLLVFVIFLIIWSRPNTKSIVIHLFLRCHGVHITVFWSARLNEKVAPVKQACYTFNFFIQINILMMALIISFESFIQQNARVVYACSPIVSNFGLGISLMSLIGRLEHLYMQVYLYFGHAFHSASMIVQPIIKIIINYLKRNNPHQLPEISLGCFEWIDSISMFLPTVLFFLPITLISIPTTLKKYGSAFPTNLTSMPSIHASYKGAAKQRYCLLYICFSMVKPEPEAFSLVFEPDVHDFASISHISWSDIVYQFLLRSLRPKVYLVPTYDAQMSVVTALAGATVRQFWFCFRIYMEGSLATFSASLLAVAQIFFMVSVLSLFPQTDWWSLEVDSATTLWFIVVDRSEAIPSTMYCEVSTALWSLGAILVRTFSMSTLLSSTEKMFYCSSCESHYCKNEEICQTAQF